MWVGPTDLRLRAAAKRTLRAKRPVYAGRKEKKKKSQPQGQGPKLQGSQTSPACQDSQVAGNLHNILCKLISD